jgi:hypothetical protein
MFADFVQLTPERSLTIMRNGDGAQLRIVGGFPRQSGVSKVRTHLVAIAERAKGSSADQVWEETGRVEFGCDRQSVDLEEAMWTCSIPGSAFDGGKRRIVIEEWESWGPPGIGEPAQARLAYSEAIPF